MRTFKFRKDYYEKGVRIFNKPEATFTEGVTVLVGCNGYGKSTMLNIIEAELNENRIPCVKYDNLVDGGESSKSHYSFECDFAALANTMMSSEGEQIHFNFGKLCATLSHFIKTGENTFRPNPFARLFDKEEEKIESDERWVLIDAIDSGLSIDNVEDVKAVFRLMMKDAADNNKKLYIIVSANAYEVVRDMMGFDVNKCEYIKFQDYESYRKFVLDCRKKKDKRYGGNSD